MITQKIDYTNYLKVAAICSFVGALTTSLLIFLPNPITTDFESKTMLYQNVLYLSKLWILFIHPQVNVLASLGVAILLFKNNPTKIILGSFFLFVWAYTEMSQQSFLIDALNNYWRPGYIEADTDSIKNAFFTLIYGSTGISDSKYFLLIYGFGLGSLLYGLAIYTRHGLGKYIGIALIFIGILSLLSFSRYYLGLVFLSSIVDWVYDWIYAYLQPLVRIAIGIWIFNEIKMKKNIMNVIE